MQFDEDLPLTHPFQSYAQAAVEEKELRARIRAMLHEARTGSLGIKAARRELNQLHSRLQSVKGGPKGPGASQGASPAAPKVQVGDTVAVARLKGATGTVTKVAGDVLTVRAGALRIEVKVADVWQASESTARGARKR